MSENYGYAGKILKVDLTTGTIEYIPSSNYLPEYFGGRGLLAKLYWDNIPGDIDSFDPRNCLIFTAGPLTASGASQTATGLCASKAPMFYKHSYYVSTCAGAWPFEMKYAGFDGFVITGQSETPVYLWVNDGKCEIRDAQFLMGQGTRNTATELRKIHGNKAQIACIGPAGENKVVMATIATDSNTGFSQSGHGAVMGGKNLKAICVRGTGYIKVADPMRIIELNEGVRKIVRARRGEKVVLNGQEVVTQRDPSASYYLDMCYPMEPDTQLRRDVQMGDARQRAAACPGCAVGCKSKRKYTDGSLPVGVVDCGVAFDWLDAERFYYGGRIDNRLNWEFSQLNDDLGLDVFMTGSMHFKDPYNKVAYAPSYATALDLWYQAYKEGIVNEQNTGLPWDKFGSREFMREWLYNICYRKGFGDIIAQGMTRACDYVAEHEEFGPNRDRIRILKEKHFPKAGVFGGMNRHQINAYGLGFFGVPGQPHTVPQPLATLYCAVSIKRGKEPNVITQPVPAIHQYFYGTDKTADIEYWGPDLGLAVAAHERIAMREDSAARCEFNLWYNNASLNEDIFKYSAFATTEYMSAVFGRTFTDEEINTTMDKLVNLERAIWIREGYLEGPIDTFNEVIFEETNDDGIVYAPRDKFEQALQYYYDAQGWVDGVPTRETLEKFGLKDVADELDAKGLLKA